MTEEQFATGQELLREIQKLEVHFNFLEGRREHDLMEARSSGHGEIHLMLMTEFIPMDFFDEYKRVLRSKIAYLKKEFETL